MKFRIGTRLLAHIVSVLALVALASTPVTVHAGYFYSNSSPIQTGSTREAACTAAVNAHPTSCKGTEYVTYAQGWKCYFQAEGYYVSCNNLPCTGFNCPLNYFKIFGPVSCTAPDVYDPLTEQCKTVIPQKNEPPLCRGGSLEKGTSNPVNLTTGNKYFLETDYASPGNQNLRFGRAWNSYNQRWLFSYRQYASIKSLASDGFTYAIWVYRDNGSVVSFYRTANGPWESDADIRDTIAPDGAGWVYTHSSGQKEWFDSTGKLTRIEYLDGGTINVSHTATTVTVADAYGNHLTLTLDAKDRVTMMVDPDGGEYKYFYSAAGNLEYVSYPDASPGVAGSNPFGENNPYRQYHYEDTNPRLVTGITDENGNRYKTITYDVNGRATLSGLSDGTVDQSTFDYASIDDATDPRVAVTNALGKETVYHLVRQFGVSNLKSVEGVASTNCLADVQGKEYYPENGWVKRVVDRAGSKTYYEYYTDAGRKGLLKKRVEGEGSADARTFEFDWYPTIRLKKQEKLSGVKQTDYTYYPNGKLNTQIETDLTGMADATTRTWTTTYTYYDPGVDTRVKTKMEEGPRGVADTSLYEYSTQGYLTKMTNAVGHVTQYLNHNGRGQPGKIIDPNGKVTTLTYTPRGWLASITQDVGGINALTKFAYDAVGQLTRMSLPDATFFDYHYDNAHRLDGIQNSLGERIEYTLDAAGNPDLISFRDTSNTEMQRVDYQFDELSRLFRVYGSDGQKTQYNYNEKDHLESIDDGVNPPTQQAFDVLNRLVSVTDANSNSMSIARDSEDRVTKVSDQRGLSTDYSYDGFGNLKQVTSPDTGVTRYAYDEAGNRLSQTDARGVVTNYSYDLLNRLKTIAYPAEPGKNVTYTYDNVGYCLLCNGRLSAVNDASGVTAYFYDALGRVDLRNHSVKLSGAGPIGLTIDFTYNSAGRLTQVEYPNGQTVKYALDAAGQVVAVTRQDSAAATPVPVAGAIKHQPFGPLKAITYGNSLQMTRNYDPDGRLMTQAIAGKQNLIYDYDAVNNITNIDNQIDPTRSEAYTYDPLNQLETATGKYGAIAYAYDVNGNRTQLSLGRGGQSSTETYIYPQASNRLDRIDIQTGTEPLKQRRFVYDSAGNLVDETRADGGHMRPHYDNTNRMDSVTP